MGWARVVYDWGGQQEWVRLRRRMGDGKDRVGDNRMGRHHERGIMEENIGAA